MLLSSTLPLPRSHQAVSLQGLDQRVVHVLVQHQSILQVLHEVQVFESWPGLLSFLLGCSPLIGGALQVIFEVHANYTGQYVVHHHDADVLPT